ncbi:MAG: TGS domain-containing protein, partial [Candidatus Nanohaloarchaea archaeon]
VEKERKKELEAEYDLCISAAEEINLGKLKQKIFEELNLIRVYMKEKGEEPDKEDPLVMKKGSTVEDALNQLPGDKETRFKSAKITGPSSKFPEQKVGMDHTLKDEDVLELNLKRI